MYMIRETASPSTEPRWLSSYDELAVREWERVPTFTSVQSMALKFRPYQRERAEQLAQKVTAAGTPARVEYVKNPQLRGHSIYQR